ncbi:MAG: polyisoprenoid-binding protein [Calditrichaeota bacterium]|nr:MAG: polyisoprenoid-binding protein [Calditrichota bacterium]
MKMKHYVLTLLIMSCFSIYGQSTWILDKPHSSIGFEVDHIIALSEISDAEQDFTLGVTRGQFTDYSISFFPGKEDLTGSKVEAVIRVGSVDTENDPRDAYLKSAQFFDVENYPTMKFVSTSFEHIKDNQYKLKGNLTIKGITKPIELDVQYSGKSPNPQENDYISFTATGLLYRNEYGLVWGDALEKGGFRISYYVKLNIQANFYRK